MRGCIQRRGQAGAIVADADPGYFFTIIAKLELAAGDDYLVFTGCEVASATMDMPLNDKVSVNYDIFGLAQTVGSAMPGTATLGTLTGKSPFTTGFTGATVMWDGAGSAWRVHGIAHARQSG